MADVETVVAPAPAPQETVPAESTEEAAPLSQEEIGALADGTATPEGAAPETPAPAAAEAPAAAPQAAEPGLTAAEVRQLAAAFQQREQQNQAEIARHQEEAAQLRNVAEERQYKADLETAGYTPEQVKEQVGHLRNYQVTTAANAKEKAELAQLRNYLETTIQNSARSQALTFISQKHGVPIATVVRVAQENRDDPFLTEAKIQVMKAEAELAKLRQAAVPVQRFAGAGATLTGGGSDSALLDQYNQGIRNDATNAAARRAAGG